MGNFKNILRNLFGGSDDIARKPKPAPNLQEVQQPAGGYKEGDVITGGITRIVPFGAFVQVEGGVEGIIPNAEFPRKKGATPLAVGDEVEVKVLNVRADERKMTLSLRALQPPEEYVPREPREPREMRDNREPRESRNTEVAVATEE